MSQHIQAIYSNGILKPLSPLDLQEEEKVRLSVFSLSDDASEQDLSYLSIPPRKVLEVEFECIRTAKGFPMVYDNLVLDSDDE